MTARATILRLVEPDETVVIRRGVRADAPERIAPDAARVAAWCAAGVSVGLALVWVLDRLTGGPGLGVMLGW